MQNATNPSQTHNTRRNFLKSSGALAAGMYLTGAHAAAAEGEMLALKGGPKAVTAPFGDASKWPRYGKEEKEAVVELVESPSYGPIRALEGEWKEYFKKNIHGPQDGPARSAGDGIASISVEKFGFGHGFGNLPLYRDCGKGMAVAQSLAHHHDVRRRVQPFESPVVGAQPAESRLDFIDDAETARLPCAFKDLR